MPSYYEALPIYKVAMDVAVRVDAVVQRFANAVLSKNRSLVATSSGAVSPIFSNVPWLVNLNRRSPNEHLHPPFSRRDRYHCGYSCQRRPTPTPRPGGTW